MNYIWNIYIYIYIYTSSQFIFFSEFSFRSKVGIPLWPPETGSQRTVPTRPPTSASKSALTVPKIDQPTPHPSTLVSYGHLLMIS